MFRIATHRDAIACIQYAVKQIYKKRRGLDAWERDRISAATDALNSGLFALAIAETQNALTPKQLRNESYTDPLRRGRA